MQPNDGNTRVSLIDPSDFTHNGSPIFFVVNLNNGFGDELKALSSSAANQHWVLGNNGMNFNADTSSSASLVSSTIDRYQLAAGAGNNTISAQGGFGTGAPYDRAGTLLELDGESGNDTLEGSENGDLINAGAGDDVLRGFGGDDGLEPGLGNDTVDGGTGSDTVNYGNLFATPVKVDLSQTGPQDTGAGAQTITVTENVSGTVQADTLVGDNGPNRLTGGGGSGDRLVGGLGDDDLEGSGPDVTVDYSTAPAGETIDLTAGTATGGDGADTLHNIANIVGSPFADTLVGNAQPNVVTGLGGNDTVATLAGADKVDVRDGTSDTVGCGSEVDSVTADQRSVDQVNADCENVDFLPEPTPLPTTTTGGGTTGTGSTAPTGGAGAATDRTLAFTLRAAHAQRVLRQKGVVLKVTCPDEACTAIVGTTGTLKGLRTGMHKRVAAGIVQTIKVRLTGAQLRTALRADKRGSLKVTVNAVDAAGNVVTRTLRVRVRR
jgi:Ca2+-binding RTX toxin-like protein